MLGVILLCQEPSYNKGHFCFLAMACGPLPSGTNTEKPDNTVEFLYGEMYTYTCLEGYEPDGTMDSSCLADNTWSLIDGATCKGI